MKGHWHRTGLAMALLLLVSCGEEKPKKHYTLKEVIDLEGSCSEDHAKESDKYAGQVVRWLTDETGEIDTYGSVTRTGDVVQRVLDEAKNPNAYHAPFMISFDKITIDTSAPVWTLHGVSDSKGDLGKGYESTCQVRVVKRGTKLRDPSEAPR